MSDTILLNVPLLQFHLFKNLKTVIADRVKVVVRPSISLVPAALTNMADANSYVKFISSIYRVDIDNFIFYFFFRNKKADDNSFTQPSSLEIATFSGGTYNTVYKVHYFGKNNVHPDGILYQLDDVFYDEANMKNCLVTISDTIVNDFVHYLESRGIL